jgi:hypothetical protein
MTTAREYWRRASFVLLVLCLGAAGCASSDGGVGGTGIATVRGNVLDPDLPSPTAELKTTDGGAASAANILVRVRNTTVEDLTDDNGDFVLKGMISGDITVEFSRDDRPQATVEVFVPVNSEIILENVELVDETATPEMIRVENLTGTIVGEASCQEDGGSFRLRDEGGLEFGVVLTADTQINLASNPPQPLTCSDLSEDSGETKLRGVQVAGQITAEDVRVQRSGSRPRP